MNGLIRREGLENEIVCDSAGILSYHAGEPADQRMQSHANKRGYKLTSISRQVNAKKDFDEFEMIIGMDDKNIMDLKALARTSEDLKKVYKMTDFCSRQDYDTVPDPYYGGDQGFEVVLDILEDACEGLLDYLRNGK
jgi:protein-tyrosine phosphatase